MESKYRFSKGQKARVILDDIGILGTIYDIPRFLGDVVTIDHGFETAEGAYYAILEGSDFYREAQLTEV